MRQPIAGAAPTFPSLGHSQLNPHLETSDRTSAGTPGRGGRHMLVWSLVLVALVCGVFRSAAAHCEVGTGQGPGKLAVGIRIASIQAANQAARDQIDGDDISGPGKGEIVSVIKIVRPGHPEQAWAGIFPILGVNTYSFQFSPFQHVYDNSQKDKLHKECEPMEGLSLFVRSIEDDGKTWAKIQETVGTTASVAGLFVSIPVSLSASLTAISVATFGFGSVGDESLGEGSIGFDDMNRPDTDTLETVTTTNGIDGASMLYQFAFAIKELGTTRECAHATPPPKTASATRCYPETVQQAYTNWLNQLQSLHQIDNEPGETRQFTPAELEQMRSDARSYIWMVVDEFTEGLVNSISEFTSSHAQALAALQEARSLQASDPSGAIERYRESAMIAFGILSSDSTDSCGGAGGSHPGRLGDEGGLPRDFDRK